jgi:single-strand DNA-binding protein
MLIGNLTRDPEMRYTPAGTAVCTFSVATNRSWQPADGGERKEDVEFHRIVAWNKLAELCTQLLSKGRKVYVEGRLQTRQWQTPDGQPRQTTEIVIDDMRVLDSKPQGESVVDEVDAALPDEEIPPMDNGSEEDNKKKSKPTKTEAKSTGTDESLDDTSLDDLPF